MEAPLSQLCISRFKSNHYESASGFQIRYKSSNVSQWSYNGGECGANFTTPNGLLVSPSFPNTYPLNLKCIYTILPSTGTFLKLKILMFDVYNGDCLEIRDGNYEDSPVVGKFCENNIPASILMTQNQARIM